MEGETKQNTQNQYLVPGAVVIAGILVAGAVLLNNNGSSAPVVTDTGSGNQPTQPTPPPPGNTDDVREITSEDHVKGNPNAAVVVVEYSDFECPFCKRFHDTMNTVMENQGADGEVAWVYRHFPLDQLHPKNARVVASAAECVNELAGNNAFWGFTDGFMAVTPSNDRTDLATVLPQLYKDVGVDQAEVESCIDSGRYDEHIQDDIDNAILTGGRGTPWSIIITPNGKTFPLSGAQPLASVEQLIELASQEK